jgi:hypothetical protein
VIATLAQAAYIGAFLAAGVRLILAQIQYIRLYTDRAYGVRSEEEARRNPWRWATPAPERSLDYWRIVWERQADRELERARLQVVRRWWLTLAVMVLGFPIMMAVPVLVGS